MNPELPEELRNLIENVRGKRAKIVIQHILQYGFVTTEDLEQTYGYRHPPRAVRDVREQGVPIETFRVETADGKHIAAYRLGSLEDVQKGRLGGRNIIPKALKRQLIEQTGAACVVCGEQCEARYLQLDHRVPYEVAGDPTDFSKGDFMLVCGSRNRAKSWSCENCQNFTVRDVDICTACYWANPTVYEHIAMRSVRRLDLTWTDDEIALFEQAREIAHRTNMPMRDYIKWLLAREVKRRRSEE